MVPETPSPHARTLLFHALATLGLTAAHHVYGGLIYGTPWRLHGAAIVVPLGLVLAALYATYRKRPTRGVGYAAGFGLTLVALVFPVAVTGAFEGFYNHVLKNVLFFAGASHDLLLHLFRPPTYELPNDVIFELSGIAQVVPAAFAGVAALHLLGDLLRAQATSGSRLEPGALIPTRELVTTRGRTIRLPSERSLTHLQFRRFAGCPVCNLHLRSFEKRHADIEAAGLREIVLFHAGAEQLAAHVAHLPFDVVGDPNKLLYAELGVESAPRALLDPRAWLPIVRAVLFGIVALVVGRAKLPAAQPQGGRLGLPADFLIDSTGRVLASHYGEYVDDQWSVDELLDLAARWRDPAPANPPLVPRPRIAQR